VLLTDRPIRTAVFQDRKRLRGVGVLLRVEAPRPFSLVFPEPPSLHASPHQGKYVLVAPSGVPIGACTYQQVELQSDDGQPMSYSCMYYEYTDDEMVHVLVPREFFCTVGDNVVHIARDLGDVYYYEDAPPRRIMLPATQVPAAHVPLPVPAAHVPAAVPAAHVPAPVPVAQVSETQA
jgi:hypothetical protein